MSWQPRAKSTAPQQTRPRAPRSAHITLVAILLIIVMVVSSVAVGIALWIQDDSSDEAGGGTTQQVSTDNTAKDPVALYGEMVAAVSEAGSFRRTGTVNLGGEQNPELDLRVDKQGNGQATIKLGDGEGEIVIIKQGEGKDATFDVYAKGRSLWAELFREAPQAPDVLADDWYQIPSEGDYAELHEGFVRLAGPDNAKSHFNLAQGAARGQETEIDGREAVVLVSEDRGAKVYVPAEGTPYPMRIERQQDDVSFTFDYTDYGQDFDIQAPQGAIPFEEGLARPIPAN